MKKVLYFIIFFFIFTSSGSASLFGEEFTLQDIVDSIEKNSPYFKKSFSELKENRFQYSLGKKERLLMINGNLPLSYQVSSSREITGDMQDSTVVSAGTGISFSQLLPTAGTLTGSISDSIGRTYSAEGLVNSEWENTLTVSAAFKQPLFFLNAYKAADMQLKKNFENSRIQFNKTRNEIIIRGVEDFYTIKQLKFSLELITSRLKADTVDYGRTEREFSLGAVTKSSLYQAKKQLIQSKTDMMQAEQKIESALSLFKEIYALKEKVQISSSVKIFPDEDFNREGFLREVLKGNPDILTIKNAIHIQKAAITIKKKDQAPVFSFSGDLSLKNEIQENVFKQLDYSITAMIDTSIFDGGRYAENLNKMKETKAGLGSDLDLSVIQVKNQVMSLFNAQERMRKLMELYGLQIEAAEYEVVKGKKDLELGQITKREFSELESEFEQALLDRQQNIINMNLNYLKLLALRGDNLSGLPLLRKEK